jgi:hypothetical protein
MPALLRRRGLILLALLAVTALAYWPGLSGGFLFDDYPNIVQQDKVHAADLSLEAMRTAAWAYGGPIGRPVATISFAIDHAFWGLDPWGYKLSGLLVHLFNAMLVYLLVGRLLLLAGAPVRAGRGATFAIALLWAIHPLQVSTVLYVVQRMETLSLSFVLLALLCYIRGRVLQMSGARAWPWLLACLPLVALGLLSKETAALFAAFTLALELTVLGFRASSASVMRGWRLAYLTGVTLSVIVFLLVILPQYIAPEVYAVRNYTAYERLLTQLRVLPMYLGWILLPQPAGYFFYYDGFPHSQGWLQPVSTLVGGVFLVGLAAASFALRRKMPLFSLGILWFFAAHSITSNVVPLELVFEHRNYFALLGILLAMADLFFRLPTDNDSRLRVLMVALLLVGALVLTLIRSASWGNPLLLALDLVAKNPESPRASMDLGEQYMLRAGKDPSSRFYALAEAEFERGSRVPNASPMPEQGLIVLAATAGQPAKVEWWDRVVHKLKTRAIGPQELSMITGLMRMREEGMALDDDRLAEAYQVLAERAEMPPSQYYAFGKHALLYAKDEQLANSLFRRAVDLSIGQPRFAASMAEALQREGHPRQAQAVAEYARAIGQQEIALPSNDSDGDVPPDAEKPLD